MIHALCAISFGQEKTQVPIYRLAVRIDPALSMISCRTEIQNPNDSCFILNKDMKIHRIIADGKPVVFHQNPSNFMPNASEISIGSIACNNLDIEYSGQIKAESYPPIVNVANMIKPDLVELAMYVTWYPRLKNGALFNFQLEADLPSTFVTVTNGFCREEKSDSCRTVTKWESFKPGYDIALLAAPQLQKSDVHRNGVTVEIYYDKIPGSYVDSMKSNLLLSMDRLTHLLGSPKSDTLIRVAYSPRKMWGYVRTPFIIVSEGNALAWRSQKFGPARDFRYLTHEISHYWWGLADINTPDDWINEGLAEYSAFLISEEIIGKDFTDQLLREYKQHAADSKTETAIAETEQNSPDREVNRYDKPVLLFDEARRRFGNEKMNRFLKSLYKRFAETGKATTALFLDETEKRVGKEARDFFAKALYSKKWNETGITTN